MPSPFPSPSGAWEWHAISGSGERTGPWQTQAGERQLDQFRHRVCFPFPLRLSVNQITDSGVKVLYEELTKYKLLTYLGYVFWVWMGTVSVEPPFWGGTAHGETSS